MNQEEFNKTSSGINNEQTCINKIDIIERNLSNKEKLKDLTDFKCEIIDIPEEELKKILSGDGVKFFTPSVESL